MTFSLAFPLAHYEVIVFIRGNVDFWIEGRRKKLEYGDIVIVNPREIHRTFLQDDSEYRGGVSGFFDATSQREGDASLVTGQLPDGIAGACTGDIPGQILPAPAAPFGAAIPKLF